MDEDTSLTAVEVAELLKITKNTVYVLVKRGEIAAYKVGKKLRIDKKDVQEYITNQKNTNNNQNSYSKTITKDNVFEPENKIDEKDIIISGQDVIIDILANSLASKTNDIRILQSKLGSYLSLYELYNDRVSIASAHLWDGDTNEYNTAYVRKLLPGISCNIINLCYRTQGFYVAKGNPKNIKTWSDLLKKDISMINREKGSGTRILLDEKLRLHNTSRQYIKGYNIEKTTHLSVASSIARGEGDVGIGIEKVALQVSGVEFIPLQIERYDLIIKRSDLIYPVYQRIIKIIQSQEFKDVLEGLGGYDLKDIGKILAQT
ncbi:substrate-binding domain-containing protein [Clostridium vincentii]|uniref:Thiosulfate transporter subunit n=1 Tax=Clostridium vincentii TaxID=52704 RepID=A0A2T0BL73_9CLOT|nr:helix-turn-helix transcriptional regulator [Clostridium vincentii]PRR84625.1 thiosulfate transporter subunit [Clostridium vincentii]